MNQPIQKTIMIAAIALITSTGLMAQEKPASPPKTATANVGGNQVTINYSSPSVKGRKIWGGLEAYDKVWRTGANNATTIEVSKDCKVNGNELKAGKYSLFTIPGKKTWTVIINSVADQWGAYSYDQSKDVFRFTVTPSKVAKTEMLTIAITDAGKGSIAWDELSVPFEIK